MTILGLKQMVAEIYKLRNLTNKYLNVNNERLRSRLMRGLNPGDLLETVRNLRDIRNECDAVIEILENLEREES